MTEDTKPLTRKEYYKRLLLDGLLNPFGKGDNLQEQRKLNQRWKAQKEAEKQRKKLLARKD